MINPLPAWLSPLLAIISPIVRKWHLHFAVLRNRGLGIESLPVTFAGPDASEFAPQTGGELVAY
jgi:hypothetical protein